MNSADDSPDDVVGSFPGDAELPVALLDRLLDGELTEHVNSPRARALADLIAALAGPARPDELRGEAGVMLAFRRAGFGAGDSPYDDVAVRALLRTKTVAAVLAGTLAVGGVAAAYGGALPDVLQEIAHRVIGVPAPQSDGDAEAMGRRGPVDQGFPGDGPNSAPIPGTATSGPAALAPNPSTPLREAPVPSIPSESSQLTPTAVVGTDLGATGPEVSAPTMSGTAEADTSPDPPAQPAEWPTAQVTPEPPETENPSEPKPAPEHPTRQKPASPAPEPTPTPSRPSPPDHRARPSTPAVPPRPPQSTPTPRAPQPAPTPRQPQSRPAPRPTPPAPAVS